LNTPRLVADSTGTTVWRWDQAEPFGNNVPDENPSGLGTFDLPLRLPGQYYDKETNLHYNYFRDYDPSIGRYGESDPIGLLGGLNTYAYVGSRPLTLVDPTGTIPPAIAAAGWILSGVVAYDVVQGAIGFFLGQPAICAATKARKESAESAWEACQRRKRRGDNCECEREYTDMKQARDDHWRTCVGGTTSSGADMQGGERWIPRLTGR
jgi:RHS repeat-associated protein